MDFFQRQDKARSQTLRLVALFVLGMLVTAFLVHLVVAYCAYMLHGGSHMDHEVETTFADFLMGRVDLFFIDMIVTSAFIGIVALTKTSALNAEGPDGIARSLGGSLVERGDSDPRERRLYNVVEEIALAAGTPIPRVYIMRSEPSINACAIGTSPENAAVCVTAGSMNYLTRDELQGVIAHEFSHIVNNDVRLNTKLMGFLFGLELIAIIAAFVFRLFGNISYAAGATRSRNDKEGGAFIFVLVAGMLASGALFVIGYVGVFFGNLIRAAISRQREYLADASAVAFTRNPKGIAGALKKIGCPNLGSSISNSNSVQASHMFFGSVFSAGFLQSLFQTHPDLTARIKAIDPTFDGVYPSVVEKNDWSAYENDDYQRAKAPNPLRRVVEGTQFLGLEHNDALFKGLASNDGVFANLQNVQVPSSAASATTAKKVDVVPTGNLGMTRDSVFGSSLDPVANANKNSSSTHGGKLKVVSAVLKETPAELDAFLVDMDSARAAFYTILLSRDSEECATQRNILIRDESSLIGKLSVAWTLIHGLGDATRLVVARKAAPLLKTMSSSDYKVFRKVVLKLCETDGILDIFEYTLLASTIREMDLYYRLTREPKIAFHTLESVRKSFGVVLSYLAREGALNSGDESAAFEAGCNAIGISADLLPKAQCSLTSFSAALNELAVSAPLVKRDVLRAFYQCVTCDGVITESEAAMMSAITAALRAPAPIWQEWI